MHKKIKRQKHSLALDLKIKITIIMNITNIKRKIYLHQCDNNKWALYDTNT